jgi:hypothetical protein
MKVDKVQKSILKKFPANFEKKDFSVSVKNSEKKIIVFIHKVVFLIIID